MGIITQRTRLNHYAVHSVTNLISHDFVSLVDRLHRNVGIRLRSAHPTGPFFYFTFPNLSMFILYMCKVYMCILGFYYVSFKQSLMHGH